MTASPTVFARKGAESDKCDSKTGYRAGFESAPRGFPLSESVREEIKKAEAQLIRLESKRRHYAGTKLEHNAVCMVETVKQRIRDLRDGRAEA